MPVKKTKKVASRKIIKEVEVAPVVMSKPEVVKPMKVNPRILASALVLIGVGLLTYKLGPWFVPAIVDKTPITKWQVYERLEKNYGAQALDDMINEKVLDLAIAKTGTKVEQKDVDAQLAKIEEQFANMGGLEEALKSRGLSREDLKKQVSTQIAVETILKEKITPSDEEVTKYFADNSATLYKDKKIDDVKGEITESLKQSKLRDEFMTWFAEAKKSITVKNFSTTTVMPISQE